MILKWVLDGEDEPGRETAMALLDGWKKGEVDLWVPTLWLYEVGNTLCRKRPADAVEILAALEELGLQEVALHGDLVSRSATLALDHGLTFYDASYLAIAESKGVVLITADVKFFRRIPAGFSVQLLPTEAT